MERKVPRNPRSHRSPREMKPPRSVYSAYYYTPICNLRIWPGVTHRRPSSHSLSIRRVLHGMLSTLSAGPPLSTTHSLALTRPRPRPTPVAVVCAITATVGGYAPYYVAPYYVQPTAARGNQDRRPPTRPGPQRALHHSHHSLTWAPPQHSHPYRSSSMEMTLYLLRCLLASPILSPLAKLSYAPYPDRPLHTSVDKNYRFGKLSTPPHAWDSLAPSRVAHHAASNY
ncbi:hypothetical protein BKA56DRAFT_686834 [Ilyonectria sp. MPI-CAGE-AT-0026]|nr:hypothetical protein BKA56DRAFT_686834 [Ilyonectria sp. MPI-CAGE-AT-0026]